MSRSDGLPAAVAAAQPELEEGEFRDLCGEVELFFDATEYGSSSDSIESSGSLYFY